MTDVSDDGTDVMHPPSEQAAIATTVGTADGPASASMIPPVVSGDILGERYRIIEMIGQGGMGTVFVAEHTTIGKHVAIKVLGEDFAHRATLVERFVQEARAASLIRHPHIVDITDFGFVREGLPYFVMEYLEGQTLAQRIADQRRIPWPAARDIMLQICAALQAAHDKGVIHRDMKPDNIFLIDRGGNGPFVKVLDFGIAKIVAEEDKNLTKTGTVMGTAAYMSPEQAQSLSVDTRTDIYATGVVLYEMLTGRVPFDAGGFVGVLTKHITERVPSMRSVAPEAKIPRALDRAVLRALHKDRDDRYASADELAAVLHALGEDGGAAKWRSVVPLGLAAGLAVVAGAAWGITAAGDSDGIHVPSPQPRAAAGTRVPEPAADDPPVDPTEAAQHDAVSNPATSGEAPLPALVPHDSATSLPDVRDIADALPETSSTDALPELPTVAAQLPGLNDPELGAHDSDTTTGADTDADTGSTSATEGESRSTDTTAGSTGGEP
ncbi:MAG: protein kinase [Nannocystaceae bacterium]|nr:protein kinase [Nannocystaceae bacterium]